MIEWMIGIFLGTDKAGTGTGTGWVVTDRGWSLTLGSLCMAAPPGSPPDPIRSLHYASPLSSPNPLCCFIYTFVTFQWVRTFSGTVEQDPEQ